MLLDEDILHLFADLISRIEHLGVGVEGLYRIAGVKTQIKALEKDLTATSSRLKRAQYIAQVTSIHTLTATLKSYLRKLSPPLLTEMFYDDFIKASKLVKPVSQNEAMAKILRRLPQDNLELIRKLRKHLFLVVAQKATNRMTLTNVALMFAPNWMRSNKGAIGDITDQGGQAKVTVTILSAAKGSAIYSVLYPSTQSSSSLAPKPSVPASPQSVQVQSVQVKLKSVKSVAQTPSPLKETSQAILERRQVTVEAFQMTVDEAEKNKPSPEQIFKTFDMDADGAITSEEFNDCCRAVGYIIGTSDLHAVFRSSLLTRTQTMPLTSFLKALEKVKAKAAKNGLTIGDLVSPFAYFDKGDTGKLSKDELVYLCRQCGGADALTHQEISSFVEDMNIAELGFDYKSQVTNTVIPLLP